MDLQIYENQQEKVRYASDTDHFSDFKFEDEYSHWKVNPILVSLIFALKIKPV